MRTLSTVLAVLWCFEARAALISFDETPNALIPDNNATGLAYGFNVTDPGFEISSISVTLNISGGFNGDLYAYLSHGDGFATLLNRVGVTGSDPDGYSDAGFNNVRFVAGGDDIHQYRVTQGGPGVPTGDWGADGRLNPTDTARDNTLAVFYGMNPAGDWTLFIADRSAGSAATLNSWEVEMNVAPVPEPTGIALAIFGCFLAGRQGFRLWRNRTSSRARR